MAEKVKFSTIDSYIEKAKPEVRGALEEIRQLVKNQVPEAIETIGYQMPAFKRDKIFFYFAAFKNHIGIYPPVKGDEALEEELLPYRGPKGNLKFPLDQAIPSDLIARVALALAGEYAPPEDE